MTRRAYVSFDWAIKKLLRQKSNFEILEGFLSEYLGFDVKIQEILESEANKDTAQDKLDRVDILVKSDKGELILVELQYDSEVDYFHRMIYGISKLISQYISEGEPYGNIKKVYSINIVYFSLCQGQDYLYEYRGEFFGISSQEVLKPTKHQKQKYDSEKISDIFPKYYIIRVNNFKKETTSSPVEEWLYFLQQGEIPEHFKAKSINNARVSFQYEKMNDIEKQTCQRFVENRCSEMAVKDAIQEGFEKGIQEGIEKGILKITINAIKKGFDKATVAELTDLSEAKIEKLCLEI